MLQRVTDQNHDEMVGAVDCAVLDFMSAWCATCAHLERILEEISLEKGGNVMMAKVDIVESPQVTMNYGVMGVPTMVFLRQGQPVHQVTFTSHVSKEKISRIMEEHLGV